MAACTPPAVQETPASSAFDGPTEAKIVRHAKRPGRAYFLLGVIAKDDTVDVRQELRLGGGEKAVNFSVKNEQDFVDTLVLLGGIILTVGSSRHHLQCSTTVRPTSSRPKCSPRRRSRRRRDDAPGRSAILHLDSMSPPPDFRARLRGPFRVFEQRRRRLRQHQLRRVLGRGRRYGPECETFLTTYCSRVNECSLNVNEQECLTDARTSINCGEAADVSGSYDRCLDELRTST